VILQIWPTETIENILWATQIVIEVATPILIDKDRSPETKRGFCRGFQTGLDYIINEFEVKPVVRKVWRQEDVRDTLLAIHWELQPSIATLDDITGQVEFKQGVNEGIGTALWSVATLFGVNLWPSRNGSAAVRDVIPLFNPGPLFRQNIQDNLRAIDEVWRTIMTSSADKVEPVSYLKGFKSALEFMAQALGIDLLSINTSSSAKSFPFWRLQDIKAQLLMVYERTPVAIDDPAKIACLSAYWQGYKTAILCLASSFGLRLDSDGFAKCLALAA